MSTGLDSLVSSSRKATQIREQRNSTGSHSAQSAAQAAQQCTMEPADNAPQTKSRALGKQTPQQPSSHMWTRYSANRRVKRPKSQQGGWRAGAHQKLSCSVLTRTGGEEA